MTHPLIKDLAVELAGIFYDKQRSERFRKAYPTPEHYFKGHEVRLAGRVNQHIVQGKPGWQHHAVLARKMLTKMLKMPGVDQWKKDKIYEAITEEAALSKAGGKRVQKLAQARH